MMCRLSKKIIWIALAFSTGLMVTLSFAGEKGEFTAHVAALDVEGRHVTLNARAIRNEEYRIAFDAEIKLLNGDTGSIANIRTEDYVTVVVDKQEKVIHALHVVK